MPSSLSPQYTMIKIKLMVETPQPLPAGEQIFLAGSLEELGRWAPDGIPLTRTDDNLWEAMLWLRTSQPFEFKITRGSWDTEEVDAAGRVPANRQHAPSDGALLRIAVAGWKDGASGQPRRQITGDYRVLPRVRSQFLELEREVIVWLPPGYEARAATRFPVLYMQDGRQVFDPNTSTWGQDWQVDELAQDLILTGALEPFLVVAVDCTSARREEYSPAARGPQYLRFLLEELKPQVDATWRTDPGRSAIAGASLGGLISFYAAWTHPEIFFGAACLSPAFSPRYGLDCFHLVEASRQRLPNLKLFLSCGGAPGLEAELLDGTLQMANRLKAVGFPEKNLAVRIESWAEHHEEAWARMTPHWLKFLFGRTPPPVSRARPRGSRP